MIQYFETIKCENYISYNLSYHEKRIFKTVGLKLSLQKYIKPTSKTLQRCKVIYNEKEIIDIKYFPYKKRQIKSFKLIFNNNIKYSKKFLDRDNINKLFNEKSNCDDIIIIKNGIVTDTSIANIAIFLDNKWLISKDSLLEGTTKKRFLENKKIEEKNITLDMLKKASKIALLNAMIDFDVLEDYSFFL